MPVTTRSGIVFVDPPIKIKKQKEESEQQSNSVELFIRDLMGNAHSVICQSENNTIETVKKIYYILRGIPVDQQRLIYAGVQLADECTLKDYNIKTDSTIHIVCRLSGS